MRKTSIGLYGHGPLPESKRPELQVRKLALGILLQAFRDVAAPRESSKEDWLAWRKDAMEWFCADDLDPGSLNWVCEILGVNPCGLRRWIREYEGSEEGHRREWARKLIRFHIPH